MVQKFKAKDSKIAATPFFLRNISKDWSVDNMKKTRFNGYVYDFSIDYDAIEVDDIKDIHEYLIKENNIVWLVAKQRIKMFRFITKNILTGLTVLSSLVSTTSLSCISMNNQECKVRPENINVNCNEPVLYPFSIKTSKCSGSYNKYQWSICKNVWSWCCKKFKC